MYSLRVRPRWQISQSCLVVVFGLSLLLECLVCVVWLCLFFLSLRQTVPSGRVVLRATVVRESSHAHR